MGFEKSIKSRASGFNIMALLLFFITVILLISCTKDDVPAGKGRAQPMKITNSITAGTGRDPSLHNNNMTFAGSGRDLTLQNNGLCQSKKYKPKHQMVLNEYGKIAEKQWFWLAEQYPYVILHEFVVMPNHIHGIIEINRAKILRTGHDLSQQNIKIKSLSELMGAYKTTVSKQIHLEGFKEFSWQRSFHDNIIRDDKSFQNICEYINTNPMTWENDNLNN